MSDNERVKEMKDDTSMDNKGCVVIAAGLFVEHPKLGLEAR